jgi:hypothetical protein
MAGGCFLLFFGIFWSAITLSFDGFLGWSAYCQIRALRYATTTGIVTHSTVEIGDSDGVSTYKPNIKFNYSVAGQEYSGDRYRYGQCASNDRSASQIVAEHPIGKQVAVYYNPSHPDDSLLQPGLEGCDLFLAMFMLPFNLVMFGIWWAVGRNAWGRLFASPAGGAKVWDDGFQVRVRLSQLQPLACAAIATGLLAFGATFVVGFGFGGFHPTMAVMQVVWIVILLGGAAAYVGSRRKLAQGDSDLVIDVTAQQIALPRTMGRSANLVIPIRDITQVEVEQTETKASDESLPRYAPVLVFADKAGSARREKLIAWYDQARTEEFARWLREQLRIEPPRSDFGQDDSTT